MLAVLLGRLGWDKTLPPHLTDWGVLFFCASSCCSHRALVWLLLVVLLESPFLILIVWLFWEPVESSLLSVCVESLFFFHSLCYVFVGVLLRCLVWMVSHPLFFAFFLSLLLCFFVCVCSQALLKTSPKTSSLEHATKNAPSSRKVKHQFVGEVLYFRHECCG